MKRNIVVSLLLVLLMLFVVSCEEPKHEHTLEKVEAVAATCSEEGMKEYYQCSVCKLTFADKEAKTEVKDLATLKTEKDPANHTKVESVKAVESTCTVNGTVAHWHCEGCGKNYSEEKCENELKSLEAPLKAHTTVKVDAVAATCASEGMKEYYKCSVCEKTFEDTEATKEITNLDILKTAKDPANHIEIKKTDAVAATCVEEGMKGYYQCSGCKKNFIDAEAKTEVKELASLKTEKDPANHSKVNKVDAVESTCTVKGTVAHWNCEGCGKNYSDEECDNELKSIEVPLKAHETELVNAVAATCEKEGNIEYYHCSACDGNFSDAEGNSAIDTVVDPRHKEGDVVATGDTFTVGEVNYSIYKCNHNNYFIDEACTEKLYKDYFDAAGLVVTEKDGVLDAYFSDCDVFMSTESASSYGFKKAVAYFTNKNFARLGYNDEHVGGLDATENKALTLTVTKDKDGNIQITGESEEDTKPLTGITSITLNGDKSGLVMVANGGEIWNLKPYNNPLRGTYKDAAGNTLTFGRYVMKYTLSGEETFYVADIDEVHAKILSNDTNSGAHGNTTFGFRQYVFLGANLYFKWDVDLPGVPKWSGTAFCEYVPFVE